MAENYEFTFLQSKTQCVCFNHKNKNQNHQDLVLWGELLQFKSWLTWKSHILNFKNVCTKNLYIWKIINHPIHNSSRKLLLKLYKSIIRSKIEYEAPVIFSETPKTLLILNVIHNAVIRMCIGVLKSILIPS